MINFIKININLPVSTECYTFQIKNVRVLLKYKFNNKVQLLESGKT